MSVKGGYVASGQGATKTTLVDLPDCQHASFYAEHWY
jgi:hypothetical protein